MIQPKRTREWIYQWLLTWLRPLPIGSIITFQINDHLYDFCFYFRIAFTVYGVYEDQTTHEVIWFSFENDYFLDDAFLMAPRFQNYQDLMNYIIEEFYKKWNSDLFNQ